MLRLNAWIGALAGWRRRGFAVLLGAFSALIQAAFFVVDDVGARANVE